MYWWWPQVCRKNVYYSLRVFLTFKICENHIILCMFFPVGQRNFQQQCHRHVATSVLLELPCYPLTGKTWQWRRARGVAGSAHRGTSFATFFPGSLHLLFLCKLNWKSFKHTGYPKHSNPFFDFYHLCEVLAMTVFAMSKFYIPYAIDFVYSCGMLCGRWTKQMRCPRFSCAKGGCIIG